MLLHAHGNSSSVYIGDWDYTWIFQVCKICAFSPTKTYQFWQKFYISGRSRYKRVPNIWVFPKTGGKPPKSSILIGFSIINHPFWDTSIFGNTHIKGPCIFFSNLEKTVFPPYLKAPVFKTIREFWEIFR